MTKLEHLQLAKSIWERRYEIAGKPDTNNKKAFSFLADISLEDFAVWYIAERRTVPSSTDIQTYILTGEYCLHENQKVNDRCLFVCLDCGEELGR